MLWATHGLWLAQTALDNAALMARLASRQLGYIPALARTSQLGYVVALARISVLVNAEVVARNPPLDNTQVWGSHRPFGLHQFFGSHCQFWVTPPFRLAFVGWVSSSVVARIIRLVDTGDLGSRKPLWVSLSLWLAP